jgi:hypothetical protein
MPCAPSLLLALLLAQADAAELVKGLGSTRFAEREAAYERLNTLGSAALPALRSAASSPDAEVRARALDLIQKVEARLLVEPTLVPLDFKDRPLSEILETLGERCRVSFQTPFSDSPAAQGRRYTLEASEPVSLWTAVQRLCEAADLDVLAQPLAPPNPNRQSPFPNLQLVPRSEPLAPASLSGPFRVTAYHLSHHRERAFAPGAFAGGVFLNPNRPLPRPQPRPEEALPGRSAESVTLSLQIQAEPRLSILQNGPYTLTEARDEKGRSLKPGSSPLDSQRNIIQAGFGPGMPVLMVTIPLELPDEPGRLIRELRAEVPVLVSARKEQPFEIDLRDAKGKTFEDEALTLTVHDVRPEPMQGATLVELTVRFRRGGEPNPSGLPFGTPEFQAFRHNPGQPGGPVEFVDAKGRPLTQWLPMMQEPGQDGLRLTIRVQSGEAGATPAALRFYEQSRAETTVTIQLRDIPMP